MIAHSQVVMVAKGGYGGSLERFVENEVQTYSEPAPSALPASQEEATAQDVLADFDSLDEKKDQDPPQPNFVSSSSTIDSKNPFFKLPTLPKPNLITKSKPIPVPLFPKLPPIKEVHCRPDFNTIDKTLLLKKFSPAKGEKVQMRLELKSIADIGLVGFPNAGKSSLLGSLTRATPQVANYAFTTLRPQLGILDYIEYEKNQNQSADTVSTQIPLFSKEGTFPKFFGGTLTMADIPGLVEGAHHNRGKGNAFLRHIDRTSSLLFIVDIFGFQLSLKDPFRPALGKYKSK
eukprot:Sdes_comp19943_c1_seq2m12435